jgi:hypothetical protein
MGTAGGPATGKTEDYSRPAIPEIAVQHIPVVFLHEAPPYRFTPAFFPYVRKADKCVYSWSRAFSMISARIKKL